MKNLKKIIPVFLLGIILAMAVVIVLKINCPKCPISGGAIPTNIISPRLVAYDTVTEYVHNFDSLFTSGCNFPGKMKFDGDLIRPADILLSIGLDNDSLYSYVTCEKLMLQTKFGYIKDKIKIYVHPVFVLDSAVRVDLFFNQDGKICNKDGTLWENPCKKCLLCDTAVMDKEKKVTQRLKDDPADVYYIDLNNPCPPCTTTP